MSSATACPPRSRLGLLANALTAAQTLTGWAVVVGLALLGFYVHILNEQVLRGERQREEVRQSALLSSTSLSSAGRARTARADTRGRPPLHERP